jgi:hypothetical protein
MKIGKALSLKGLAFIALFTAAVLLTSNMNFSQMLGADNKSFTFFQFIGPISGGFLGAGVGMVSVFLAQAISFVYLNKPLEAFNIALLFPMVFGTLYFAKYARGKFTMALVPLACMALFIAHPVGGQVWFYSLFWLVPLIALALPENLLARSFGSTFTAHAVGSVAFLYLVPSAPALWITLMLVVPVERTLFALGISASYYALNSVFARVEILAKSGIFAIDERYVLS